MTKSKKTTPSPKRPSSPKNVNNMSLKYPASQLSDEQFVNEMFAALKPTIVILQQNTTMVSSSSSSSIPPFTSSNQASSSRSNPT